MHRGAFRKTHGRTNTTTSVATRWLSHRWVHIPYSSLSCVFMVRDCCACQHPQTPNLIGIAPQGFNEHHLIVNSPKIKSLLLVLRCVTVADGLQTRAPSDYESRSAGCRTVCERTGGDRWRPDKHKVLARRRLLKGFVRNYVMEHDRGLIGGCDHMLQATACLCSPLGVVWQTHHESSCGFWMIHYYRMCIKVSTLSVYFYLRDFTVSERTHSDCGLTFLRGFPRLLTAKYSRKCDFCFTAL